MLKRLKSNKTLPVLYWDKEETTFGELKVGECLTGGGDFPNQPIVPIWKLVSSSMYLEKGKPSSWTDHMLQIEMVSIDQDVNIGRECSSLVHSRDRTYRARPVYMRDDQISYSKDMLKNI